jgi:hypothetical protein
MVDWNLSTPQVVAPLGTNQDDPQALDIYVLYCPSVRCSCQWR